MPALNKWIGALLLPLALTARAAEPTDLANAPPATEARASDAAQTAAPAFDFRSANVRDVVKATAASQASYDYRFESASRQEPDLAAALKPDRPATPRKPKRAPRLPGPPPSCDGFISCGVEAILGLNDDDYEYDPLYQRVNRDRLMNQGVFTSWNNIEGTVQLPMSQAAASQAGAPLITLPR